MAIENALRLFSPRLAIVDEHLTRYLPRQWLTSLTMEVSFFLSSFFSLLVISAAFHNIFLLQKKETDKPSVDAITVIDAPRQSDLMIELIRKLKPQVVVTGMAQYESVTSSAFEHLLGTTREIGARLFIDISDQFELSSLPGSNGVLKYLAKTVLPPHAAIICGLLKNQVMFPLYISSYVLS